MGRERDRAEAQSRRGYSSTLDEPQRHKRKRMDRILAGGVKSRGRQHRLTSPEPRIAASAFPLSLPFPLQVKWWLRWRMLGIGGEWSDPGIALLISAACCRNFGTGRPHRPATHSMKNTLKRMWRKVSRTPRRSQHGGRGRKPVPPESTPPSSFALIARKRSSRKPASGCFACAT